MLEDECVVVARKDGIKFYAHSEFVGAFHTAFMSKLESSVRQDTSPRQMMQAVATLKSKAAHAAVLRAALVLLVDNGTELSADYVAARKLSIVATLPMRT